METVTLTIDGRQVTVAKGKTVLQAAIEAGISVPYYCYHPGLQRRRLLPRLHRQDREDAEAADVVLDGLHRRHGRHTRDPESTQARAGVLEFLLVNHPLDCPVCDKGGECPLQDFSYTFGPAESRMDFPRRVFDGEGVKADVDFGPTLMLNRNRCILCTRCVRFMREIDGDAQIGIVDRGNGSEIATFREEGVHSLLSGNLMDVCPVGAITTREYRFKSRPWDNPGVVDTICTLCSKGCSTSAWLKAKPEWAKGSRLIRMTPRFNPESTATGCATSAASSTTGSRATRGCAVRWCAAARRSSRSRGTTSSRGCAMRIQSGRLGGSRVGAIPGVGARVHRGAVRPQGGGRGLLGTDGMNAGHDGLEAQREAAARRREVHRARDRCAQRQRRARSRLRRRPGQRGTRRNLSALRTAIAAGRVKALYVVDPGPDGSLGDVSWIIAARRRRDAAAARRAGRRDDGARRGGRHRAAGRGVGREGRDLHERSGHGAGRVARDRAAGRGAWKTGRSWRTSAGSLGLPAPYQTSSDVRQAIAAAHCQRPYADADKVPFTRPIPARNWLQASNPSERWKWDFMYQDLPPVKGHNVQMEGGRRVHSSQAGGITVRALVATVALLLVFSQIAGAQLRGVKAELTPLVESDAAPGAPVRAALQVRIPDGFHVQSDAPRDPTLIPTVLTFDAPDGVKVTEIVFPQATDFKQIGQAQPLPSSSTSSRLASVSRSPSTVAGRSTRGAGHLRYQACDDRLCYPPVTADVRWTLTVAKGDADASGEPRRGLRNASHSEPAAHRGRSHRRTPCAR